MWILHTFRFLFRNLLRFFLLYTIWLLTLFVSLWVNGIAFLTFLWFLFFLHLRSAFFVVIISITSLFAAILFISMLMILLSLLFFLLFTFMFAFAFVFFFLASLSILISRSFSVSILLFFLFSLSTTRFFSRRFLFRTFFRNLLLLLFSNFLYYLDFLLFCYSNSSISIEHDFPIIWNRKYIF